MFFVYFCQLCANIQIGFFGGNYRREIKEGCFPFIKNDTYSH